MRIKITRGNEDLSLKLNNPLDAKGLIRIPSNGVRYAYGKEAVKCEFPTSQASRRAAARSEEVSHGKAKS